MDDRRRRGRSPDLSYGKSDGIARNRSVILGTIHGYYKEALAVLPLEELPELAPRLVGAGVCFGFADPTTNIIANTLSFLPDKDGEPDPDHGAKKRKRKATIKTMKAPSAAARSDLLAAAGDVPSPPETRTIAERSLEGLITFLTSYFRYLPTWDALRYLCLANADLLVAVRLIELDRCYHTKDEQFQISSYAVRAALTYAALSARQPNVDDFLAGSFSLASHLEFITQTVLVDRSCILSVEKIFLLSGMLKKPLMLDKFDNPMIFADERRLHNCHTNAKASGDANGEKVPGGLTISLRAVLLDKIHAKYLKAISRLPMQDVRARYHRALVNGGYCYGPFNCVTNIIVNTLWYDSTFSAVEKLEVDMICTSTFVRVESRSLRGLIKLLLTCIPEISEHYAMIYLLKNNLKVRKAIEMAGVEGWEPSWDVSAYKAAADASFHPELEAYVQFSTQSLPTVQSAVKSLLRASTPLSSNDVLQLAMLLPSSNCIFAKPLETIVDLSTDALDMFIAFKEKFVTQQGFFRRKIEAALRKKGYLYDLQVICVANERVGSQKNFVDFKCPYSHVNFLASPKVGSGLKLFFAEFSNDDDDVSFCCTVSRKLKHARCCYCEYKGTRIMHPAHPIENYCGGDMDFTEMAHGTHELINERIISGGKWAGNRVGMCGDDYIYFDPTRDAKLAQCMNRTASRAKISWSDILRVNAS